MYVHISDLTFVNMSEVTMASIKNYVNMSEVAEASIENYVNMSDVAKAVASI